MVGEARLEDVGSGLAPVSPGWFVVNAAEAAWLRNDAFGGRCVFESSPRVLAERPDAEPQMFAETGFTLAVLEPGKPSGMFHAESAQEDFLVLAGTCLLLVEEEERPLRAWDFVHCPAETRHTFVGTGDGPCVIFMTGARREGRTLLYPVADHALAHGAGVEAETPSPQEAYARFSHWRVGRPDAWSGLPWAG
ncbi:MAG TPA: cupin domain-containing protein [Gaiellaceae bacterium]|nr:cupin domain-containing protein [Gaiellaceae bacterium]